MKSKQLANVLIKIIGLYVCLCAIPEVFSGTAAVLATTLGNPKSDDMLYYQIPNGIGAFVQILVGIFLICKSPKLAAYWFKDEVE